MLGFRFEGIVHRTDSKVGVLPCRVRRNAVPRGYACAGAGAARAALRAVHTPCAARGGGSGSAQGVDGRVGLGNRGAVWFAASRCRSGLQRWPRPLHTSSSTHSRPSGPALQSSSARRCVRCGRWATTSSDKCSWTRWHRRRGVSRLARRGSNRAANSEGSHRHAPTALPRPRMATLHPPQQQQLPRAVQQRGLYALPCALLLLTKVAARTRRPPQPEISAAVAATATATMTAMVNSSGSVCVQTTNASPGSLRPAPPLLRCLAQQRTLLRHKQLAGPWGYQQPRQKLSMTTNS